jgi:TRAP-type C4-dicarboxylate transport system permease small subunit
MAEAASEPIRIRPGVTDRIIGTAERIAGGFLAFVVALTFVSVVLRYAFSWSIPDSYDLSRLFLGILIFWGIAVTGFRGDHITVDLVWNALPRWARRVLDLAATLFTLACMAGFAWAMATKVMDEFATGEETYDLRLPVWPFYLLAWLGLAASVLLLIVRLVRQAGGPPPDATPALPASH